MVKSLYIYIYIQYMAKSKICPRPGSVSGALILLKPIHKKGSKSFDVCMCVCMCVYMYNYVSL